MYTIYEITCSTNNKQYGGCTTRKAQTRLNELISKASNGLGGTLGEAIRQYGAAKFTVAIVATTEDRETAEETERWLIEELGSLEPGGYNSTKGGIRKTEFSSRVTERLVDKAIERSDSDEYIRRLSEAAKGNTTWVGRKHSLETRALMSIRAEERESNRRRRIEESIAKLKK